MNLKKEMEQLIIGVRQPIIMFIPEDVFSNTSKDAKAQMLEHGLIGMPYIVTTENKVTPYKKVVDDLKIIEKPKILKTHIFQLLHLQSISSEETFNYLLENYIQEVIDWKQASQWMALNAKDKVSDWSETLQITLEFQYTCLKEYYTKIISKFNITNVCIDNTEISFDALKENNLNNEELITILDADMYLLKSVFEVKI